MSMVFSTLASIGIGISALLALPLWHISLANRHKLILTVAVVAFVTLSSLALYSQLGSSQTIDLIAQQQHESLLMEHEKKKLETALSREPNRAELYAQLGQIYMRKHAFFMAATVFKKAVLLSNGNPEYVLLFAKASIMQNGGEVNAEAMRSLEIVAMLDLGNQEAQFFHALGYMQSHDYKKARKLFHTLLKNPQITDAQRELITQNLVKMNRDQPYVR